MRKFNIGDKVIVIENGQIKNGVIKSIYDELSLLLVAFEDGDVKKCHYNEVAPAPVETSKNEPEKNPEITISENEFRDIGLNLITDLTVDKTISVIDGIKATIVLSLIARKLFGKESNENE